MKRDWELIKALMLEIESREQGRYYIPEAFAGHDLASVKYHLHLLDQAGLVECELDEPWDGEPCLIGRNLTLLGHDLLDSLREGVARPLQPVPILTQVAEVARESLRRSA
ncbi:MULTISPECIES: DUF2513 domain-containing protein [Pseudomonas]|uniref:DUF2513 domain-containing protein n=1 Tax=Pseudomonas TaxID=286 RepID=UPI001C7F6FC2|nr:MULTISPECIES: DUF2513 domain-containing protein [Pseudomonas]MDH0897455.1 DUF2513 domain-containing protein [Pseudomonas sp. GD03875]MDH1067602.1 DUF2513 domain-containing protein [Pseudomonas sp. GD03985]